MATRRRRVVGVAEYKRDQLYLPPFMRDFHLQKQLFKTIDAALPSKALLPDLGVNWIQAHCYTIDKFLWFMAMHGYTLQKSRRKTGATDVMKTLSEYEDAMLKAGLPAKEDDHAGSS